MIRQQLQTIDCSSCELAPSTIFRTALSISSRYGLLFTGCCPLFLLRYCETAAGVTPSFFAACDWVIPVFTSPAAISARIWGRLYQTAFSHGKTTMRSIVLFQITTLQLAPPGHLSHRVQCEVINKKILNYGHLYLFVAHHDYFVEAVS